MNAQLLMFAGILQLIELGKTGEIPPLEKIDNLLIETYSNECNGEKPPKKECFLLENINETLSLNELFKDKNPKEKKLFKRLSKEAQELRGHNFALKDTQNFLLNLGNHYNQLPKNFKNKHR